MKKLSIICYEFSRLTEKWKWSWESQLQCSAGKFRR